ncbi:helix-turn-helix transcriptional regulator [Streptomyces phaeofaciens]|uniref:helix-turn-helix transcriptional regulator n=1 Tax=Streptomyces phaeofaciens TaxID=68254 RepID=UPI0036A31599
MIVGREPERERLRGLVHGTRRGHSGALVLRGPGGIGRTALLDDLAHDVPPDVRVLRATGVESEAELPWAGLHQVLRPLLPGLHRLPEPQAVALRAAFGLGPDAVDPFLLSLGALSLLSDAGADSPAALLVDDAQWLDPASAGVLVFIARRLETEGLAMVFAARDGARPFTAPDLPETVLRPLPPDDAETLLDRTAPGAVRGVRRRILREAEGSPLALHALPAALTDAQLGGGSPLPDHLPLEPRLRQIHLDRTAEVAERHGTVLLLAALQDDGDLTAILGAAGDRDAATAALYAAAAAGLIDLDQQRVRFRHPLVRSALYQAAPLGERHAAHRALARILDADDDRRVWHLAASTVGRDDTVAGLLANCGTRSRHAGRPVTAGHALRRAALFTTSSRARARWLVDAAACAWETAEPAQALSLLDEAEPLAHEPAARARAAQVHGLMTLVSGNPAHAFRTLLDGARLVLHDDPPLAEEMLLAAARAAWAANRPRELARTALLLERTGRAPTGRAPDRLRTLLRRLAGPVSPGTPRATVPAPVTDGSADRTASPRYAAVGTPSWTPWPPDFLPHFTGGTESALEALREAVATLRRSGATGALPLTVLPLVSLQLVTGQWTAAAAHAREALPAADESGQFTAGAQLRAVLAWTAAVRGEGDECRALADEALAAAAPRGSAVTLALVHWALGLNALAEGNAAGATRLLREVTTPGAPAEHVAIGRLALPDLVEAHARAGETGEARAALERFERCAAPAEVPVLRTAWLRCRALLADDGTAVPDDADALFGAALDATAPSAFEAGRTHLLHGEWLRRARRVKAARDHLHQALHLFRGAGAAPWAEMASQELRAAGEQIGQPARGHTDTRTGLTPRETQIVRLAAEGKSNSDIAQQLFLSPRTVGHHLYKVFPKLGITSRHQLRALRLDTPQTPAADLA